MTTERAYELTPDQLLRDFAPDEEAIPLEALNRVVPLLDRVEFPAGYRMMIQGEPGDAMYFLALGRVEVTHRKFGLGPAEIIAELSTGDVVGEMAIVNDEPRNATVTALEEIVAYRLSKSAWFYVQANNPGIATRIEATAKDRQQINIRLLRK